MSLFIENDPIKVLSSGIDQIAEVFLSSMQSDPMYVQMFQRVEDKDKYLLSFWKALTHYSAINGNVYTTSDFNAGACWLLPNKCEFTIWSLMLSRFKMPISVFGFPREARNRAMHIFSELDKLQKITIKEAHYYLMALGVSPQLQGKGIGSKLITPVLKQADQEGYKCYLETETELNVEFYEKNGFHIAKKHTLPSTNLEFWAMIRNPK
jgi:ribosomal protein S18 acetylase RimI-like enzyme